MTTPEAKAVSYSYDSLNRLTSILDTYNKVNRDSDRFFVDNYSHS